MGLRDVQWRLKWHNLIWNIISIFYDDSDHWTRFFSDRIGFIAENMRRFVIKCLDSFALIERIRIRMLFIA